MIERIIIPGPPGTGKTHRLVWKYLIKEIKEYKTPMTKIGFFTFTRTASKVAKERIIQAVPNLDWDKDLTYVSTLNAFGNSECGINTSTQLLKGKKWDAFKNRYGGIVSKLNFETFSTPDGIIRYGNEYIKLINLARYRKISLENQYLLREHTQDISFKTLTYINDCLIQFKKENQMFEFVDQISEFIKRKNWPDLNAIFLDEAQDLNNLQWEMFHKLESKAKRSYLAGDDDQAIMGFQGANSAHFIKLHSDKDTRIDKGLSRSRRCPAIVVKVGKYILSQIPEGKRIKKDWLPRMKDGKVVQGELEFVPNFEMIDFSKGKFLVQTRTNKMLEPVKDFLEDKGFYYSSKKGNSLINQDMLTSIDTCNKLKMGEPLPAKLCMKMYGYMSVNKPKNIKRGFKNCNSLKEVEEESLTMKDLKETHGLLAEGPWEQWLDKFTDKQKEYIKTLISNNEDIYPTSKARIRLSTIHGAKGDEDENIVHFLELGDMSYSSFRKNPIPEHNLQLVGVSRTINKLYLVTSASSAAYPLTKRDIEEYEHIQ
jgi:superfamily I DNA/RNA helicase